MNPLVKSAIALSALAIASGAHAEVNFTVSPESGSTVETLSSLTLISSNYEFDYDYTMNAAGIEVLKDGQAFGGVTIVNDWNDFHKLDLTLSPALTQAGTYTVKIPADAITWFDVNTENAGSMNDEEVVYTYTVTGIAGELSYTLQPSSINPADGETIDIVAGWSNISLTYARDVKMAEASASAIISSEDGSYIQTANIVDFSMLQAGLFFVQTSFLDENQLPTKNGRYTVTIPQGTFSNGREANPELVLTYEITGAEKQQAETIDINSIEFVTPDGTVVLADDLKLRELPRGTRIVFNTSDNAAVGYLFMTFNDKNALNPDQALLRTLEAHALRTLPEARGSYWTDDEVPFIDMAASLELLDGHTYEIKFEVYDFETPPYSRTLLAEGEYTILGETPTYEYSDIKVVSVDPEQGTVFHDADDAVINVEFSGAVRINTTKSFFYVDSNHTVMSGCVTMSDDNTRATIKFPASMLENAIGPVGMMLYVTDMDGRSLFFDYDQGDDSHLNLEYTCYLGTPDLDVKPEAGVLEEISHIIVSYNGKESIAWANNLTAGPVELRDLGSRSAQARVFGYIRTFEPYEIGEVPGQNGPEEGVLSVIGYLVNAEGERITITTPGTYVLHIPAASFNMGDGFSGFTCKQTNVVYTIEGEIEDETIYDFNPTQIEVTFNEDRDMANVELIFDNDVDINPDTMMEVRLYDAEGNQVDAIIDNSYSFDHLDRWYLNVYYAFVADATYELRIPQGVFGDLEWASDATYATYMSGHANAAFTVRIVNEGSAVSAIVTDSNVSDIHNLQGIKVGNTADAATLPAGLYIIGGQKVYVK